VGLLAPFGIAVEADGHLVVFDGTLKSVIRVDAHTGNLTLVSGQGVGGGPPFIRPAGIAVEADGQLIVMDSGGLFFGHPAAVVRVDPHTGNRTMVSDATHGGGPPFLNPVGIAVEADGQLIVVDSHLEAVVRVDPHTGDRTIVSR